MKQKLLIAKLPTTKPNLFVELEVYYSLGGMNFWNGTNEKRGYWVSVSPITIEERAGMVCRSFTIGGGMSGLKGFLEEATRYNARKLESLRAAAIPHLGKLLAKVIEKTQLVLTAEGQAQAQPYLQAADSTAPTPSGQATPAPLPYTIRTIIEQMGGRGISGAFVYVGASQLVHKCPQAEGEYRSGYFSKETPEGLIDYDVGLQFSVNGKRGETWKMVVAYEPDDTYSVWIWTNKSAVPGRMGAVIEHRDDVYCDGLKDTVEHMYDQAIKERNQGFIPIR